MRRFAGFMVAAAVLALAVGCGKKDSTESGGGGSGNTGSSSSGIEGTYTLVKLEANGQDITEFVTKGEKEEDKTMKVTGDKFIGSKDGKEDPATYKVDSSKNPKEIDLTSQKTVPAGPKNPKAKPGDKDKEKTVESKMYGIYKLEGDTLTICMAEGKPEDRPKDFKTAGSKAMMMVLKKK